MEEEGSDPQPGWLWPRRSEDRPCASSIAQGKKPDQPRWTGKELWPRRYEDRPSASKPDLNSLPFAPKELWPRRYEDGPCASKPMHQPFTFSHRHQMPWEETELLESLCVEEAPPKPKTAPRMPKTTEEAMAMAVNPEAHRRFTKYFKEIDKGDNGFTRWPHSPLVPNSMDEEDTENEHYKHFMTLVHESEGCYIPKVPQGVKIFSVYATAVPPQMFHLLEQAAKDALRWYNMKQKYQEEPYELVRVECGSRIVVNGSYYIVAFIARGCYSGDEFPFRAKVFSGCDGLGKYVQYCRHAYSSCERYARLNGHCCEATSGHCCDPNSGHCCDPTSQ